MAAKAAEEEAEGSQQSTALPIGVRKTKWGYMASIKFGKKQKTSKSFYSRYSANDVAQPRNKFWVLVEGK